MQEINLVLRQACVQLGIHEKHRECTAKHLVHVLEAVEVVRIVGE